MEFISMRDRPYITYFDAAMFPVFIGLAGDKKSFDKEVKRLGIKEPLDFITEGKDATSHWLEDKDKKTCLIVCIDKKKLKDKVTVIGLVVHEAVHICEWVWEKMKIEDEDTEFKAYTTQWLTQQILWELKIY